MSPPYNVHEVPGEDHAGCEGRKGTLCGARFKTLKRINALMKDMQREPYNGIGKLEPLKENMSGLWSRRIDEENRIVYF